MVRSLHRSSDGTLWLGGGNGLWRYDGGSWQNQTQVTGSVQTIYEDKDGTLWACGGGNGLWRYDNGGWQPVAGITGVSTFYEDPDGTTLWIWWSLAL